MTQQQQHQEEEVNKAAGVVTAVAASERKEDPGWHALELSFHATGDAMLVRTPSLLPFPCLIATSR